MNRRLISLLTALVMTLSTVLSPVVVAGMLAGQVQPIPAEAGRDSSEHGHRHHGHHHATSPAAHAPTDATPPAMHAGGDCCESVCEAGECSCFAGPAGALSFMEAPPLQRYAMLSPGVLRPMDIAFTKRPLLPPPIP